MVEYLSICKIKIWFPYIKAHYFIYNAALVGALPFVQVYAKQLGISAVSVGIIYTVLPFLSLLAKPLIGWLADYTKSLKLIALSVVLLLSMSCFMINFIQKEDHHVDGHVSCTADGTTFSFHNQTKTKCIENIPNDKEYYCFMNCWECPEPTQLTNRNNTICKTGKPLESSMFIERNHSRRLGLFDVNHLNIDGSDMVGTCAVAVDFDCQVTCAPEVHDCYDEGNKEESSWISTFAYVLLAIIIGVFSAVMNTLGDTACFTVLGDRTHLYGKQRMWGTIGWGAFSAVVGAFNYLITGPSFIPNYLFGFTAASFLLMWDMCVINMMKLDNVTFSKSIWEDVGKLLRKPDIILFLLSVYVIGSLTGVLWTFLYWHLTTLNGSVLLLGLVNTIETIGGELPFFYFASKILGKIGHFNSLTVSFITFGIRYILLSYITDPWWVLPIELLQGPTFGLFYATMASYAYTSALPGTETTMQGLIGGVFEGLGLATGSFLGGVSMSKFGGNWMFFWAGIVALCYAVLNILFTIYLNIRQKRADAKARRERGETPDEQTNFL